MNDHTQNFDAYTFSKQPGYDEKAVRKEFANAVPLRTVVVYCYDPRAVGIPAAVAEAFGEDARDRPVPTPRNAVAGRAVLGVQRHTRVAHLLGGCRSRHRGGKQQTRDRGN